MTRRAPVCHIAPPVPAGDPGPVDAEFIPEARDLASVIAAVNALRRLALRDRGGFGGPGHGGAPRPVPPGGVSTGGSVKNEKRKEGRWQETSRKTEKVKITNPDDETQFVEIERINSITWKDSVSGETFLWNRTKS